MYAHHQTMQQSVVEVKQRRGGPKVRTGCYTCKKRRVKCDETKPSCKRCVKAEVECDGYPPPSTRAPRSSAASQRAAILARTSPSIMSPTIILFNNDEHRYFRLYQDSAAYELSGYFESEFWTRVVLQESHIEDSVKATVIALGALTMGLAVPSGPSVDDRCGLGRIGMTTPHHQFAFRQYSRALKHLRARLASGRTGLRSALISCLLCVCFESVLGEHETAMIQVRQGLRLLNDSKFSSPESSPGASPGDNKIEDELRQMFARLEIQARSFKSSPDVPIQEDYPDPQYIPETFSDINAARIFNDRLTRRAILLSNEIEDYRYADPATHPPHLLKQQTDLLTTLELAAMANNNLYQASIKTIGVIRGSAGPVVLRTHAIMDKVLLATAFSPLETAYDAYVDDFKEVVACARAVHDARPAWHVFISKSYTFDGGLIPGLYITATKCRDSKTRWEAIAQLKGAKSREGSWDSDMAARAGEWIAMIEEQGWVGAWNHTGSDTDGDVSRSSSENGSENGSGTMISVLPEEKRVRIIDMKMDLVNNKAFIKCGQKDIGDEDWRNVREANLSW